MHQECQGSFVQQECTLPETAMHADHRQLSLFLWHDVAPVTNSSQPCTHPFTPQQQQTSQTPSRLLNPAKPWVPADLAAAKQARCGALQTALTPNRTAAARSSPAHQSKWPSPCALPTLLPPAVWPVPPGNAGHRQDVVCSLGRAILAPQRCTGRASQWIPVLVPAGPRPWCARPRRWSLARPQQLPPLPPP